MLKFNDKLFIGKRIQYHRKKMKLTQAELAELVDLSVQHISKIENGMYVPSLITFFMIVDVLKIDLQEFGYDIKTFENPVKNELINKIITASDTELIFYNNLMNSVSSALKEAKL